MKRSSMPNLPTRRDFLKGIAATGGATALLAANASPLADSVSPSTPVSTGDERKRGYRLTPHIRDYYRTLS